MINDMLQYKRNNLVEQFSTFLCLDENNIRWVTDPQLRRQMENYLKQDQSSKKTDDWALWFQKKSQASDQSLNLFRQHLYAYLQEPCYLVAYEMYENYNKMKFCQTKQEKFEEYTKKDYFQMGVQLFDDEVISKFNPLLKLSLSKFAQTRLKQRITDKLREQDKTFGYTIWSFLLNRCSAKRLKEALIIEGLSGEFLESHLLAWDYYKKIYGQARMRVNTRLQEPSDETWEEIATQYNLSPESTLESNSQKIKQWLKTCGQALRNYYNPTRNRISLDQQIGQEGRSTIGDVIEDTAQGNPIDMIEQDEEWEAAKQDRRQILAWLQEEIPRIIPPERQSEIEMRYGEGLTWQDIAERLGKKRQEYTLICKRVKTIRKKLAINFIPWAINNLHTPLTVNDIEAMSESFNQLLEYYYQNTNKFSSLP